MPRQTVAEISAQLESKEKTSVEITEAYLRNCETLNPELNALISISREQALEMAKCSDERIASGNRLSPLDGVPIILKDNICTQGIKTTCSSKMLENYNPPYDATVVELLKKAGAVIIAKANMDEFAMGSSTEFGSFGASKNPYDKTKVAGGSSGGSAVAVSSNMAPVALGSDTGGSIRQPASFCGIVGMKPTYGAVSRYGLVAFASSLDQIGPFANNVEDTAILLDAISAHDKRDSTSSKVERVSHTANLKSGSVEGLKIGRPKQFFEVEGIDDEVKSACEQSLKKLEAAGATIVDVDMPYAETHAVATYYILATAEASSNLARYDGAHYGHRKPGTENIIDMFSQTRAEGFGDEVKRRIMLGTFVLSAETFDAYYLRAQKARTLIQKDYTNALAKCDVIAAPTSPTTAFAIGSKSEGDPVQMYLADIFTLSLNLSGFCGLSMPVGYDSNSLPVGLQLMAGPFKDADLLKHAYSVEQALSLSVKEPAVTA